MSAPTSSTPPGVLSTHEVVAGNIRAEMSRRNVNGKELAARVSHAPSWVTMRLTNTRPITLDDVDEIAAALDVPASALLTAGNR